MNRINPTNAKTREAKELRVVELLGRMSLADKIGQMSQVNVGDPFISDDLVSALRAGQVGSVLNIVDVELVNELQRIAMNECPLGIPLLVGRDVIHGFKTVMPIPLGQAASWNPDTVRQSARIAAREAARVGINWTFAPMIDIARDPRWGRIAESLGEDPYLASMLGAAMIEGFQGNVLADAGSIAACAKHFVGYGAVESGRDYAATNIPENELRNVYLRPFHAAVDAGVATLMTSFSDLDGVPATANQKLVQGVLRGEWDFAGFVVSDWDSIRQLSVHGLTENDEDAAWEAATAGVDMEMHGDAYRCNLESLVANGRLSPATIDTAAGSILRVKVALGLFDNPYTDPGKFPAPGAPDALETAKQAALESVVLLQNEHDVLPLSATALSSLALLGPLAHAPKEQLGTWIFDGDSALSTTPLQSIRAFLGEFVDIQHLPVLATSRSHNTDEFDKAFRIAKQSDAVVLFLGEEAILSGEAHSRADIRLPGAQEALARRIRAAGKPVVAVILTGRPMVLTDLVDQVDAILFAPHPGALAGPALTELLFGVTTPVGKLPTTLPRMVGQIPIYHSQKNTGKPAASEPIVLIDDIDADAEQLSIGMTSYHLDAGHEPLFVFGHGLSYSTFAYTDIRVSDAEVAIGERLIISAKLSNTGERVATEVAQLYIRDLVGSVTRPVRELKRFQRVELSPGETLTVEFDLHTDDLAFYGRANHLVVEAGEFEAWIGGSSAAELGTRFRVIESISPRL